MDGEISPSESGKEKNQSTISRELSLRLVIPQQREVFVVASGYYTKEDPYAVRIAFHVGLDEPVEWIFARDLLASGLHGVEGMGDVIVYPTDVDPHEDQENPVSGNLHLEIRSPFAQAHFIAPRKEIADYVADMYALVPQGEEADYVDMDAEVARLFPDSK